MTDIDTAQSARLVAVNAGMGRAEYDFVQTFDKDNSGFTMEISGEPYSAFHEWLTEMEKMSRGEGLKPGYVPQTMYFLYVDGRPVGLLKLRETLTEALRAHGGHIGYAITKSMRGKGYGKLQLKLGLEKAREKGLTSVLITANSTNTASRGVAMANGARVEKDDGNTVLMWIDL